MEQRFTKKWELEHGARMMDGEINWGVEWIRELLLP